MEFLSEEWFGALTAGSGSTALAGVGADTAIEFDAGGILSHVVIEGGRVRTFSLGGYPGARLRLSWSAVDATRLAWATISGDAAMAVTRMSPGGTPAGAVALPPMGLIDRPEAAELPKILGASLRVQFLFPGGPFGECGYVLDFADGRLVGEHRGVAPAADVMAKVTYRAMASVRDGRMSILDALAGGELEGELAPMASLAAILEGDEFRELMAPSAETSLTLATLGDLRADPGFRTCFAAVMDRTEMP